MTPLNEHQRNTKDLTPGCQMSKFSFFAPDNVDPVPEADVVAGGGDQPQPGGEAGQVPGEQRGQTEASVSSVQLSLAESVHQHQAEAGLRQRGQRLENTAE